MKYREIQPGAAVSSFIERYWILECEGGPSAGTQRVVPDGRPELILNLGDPFESFQDGEWRTQPRSFLAGQITGPLLIRPRGPAKILGVRFHPHGAGQALGLPMQQATDLAIPLSDLSPALARELEPANVSAVEGVLRRHAGEADGIVNEAVRQIDCSGGGVDIARLAAGLGISTRQLERRFERQVGLPPKLFSRMQRFQRVFHEVEDGSADWVDAAVTCGYYDQAHLIRDFRDFSGQTPTVLLAGADLARHFMIRSRMSDFSKTAMRPRR